LFFLAMAHRRQGHSDLARACFDRAVRWRSARSELTAEHASALAGFHAEAEAVLGGLSGELPAEVFAAPR